jgi:VIT1/CCC1 family predicted Fe2+/Mn2+ transporter
VPRLTRVQETHLGHRSNWLRAAVLGANDGLISTSSLVVGVAAAQPSRTAILLATVAGLAAGTLSMAAGEYVSVSSQADTEQADLTRERDELSTSPKAEQAELAELYVTRGLSRELAIQVAHQLMTHDALGAHARDELGIRETTRARPIQAAVASAASFAAGAAPPAVLAALLPAEVLTPGVGVTLALLIVLGGMAARLGGVPLTRGALRVAFWGAVAMGCTAAVGRLFGALLRPVLSVAAAAPTPLSTERLHAVADRRRQPDETTDPGSHCGRIRGGGCSRGM